MLGATSFFDGYDRGIITLALPQIRSSYGLAQGYSLAIGATALAPNIAAFAACPFTARVFLPAETAVVWVMATEELPDEFAAGPSSVPAVTRSPFPGTRYMFCRQLAS